MTERNQLIVSKVRLKLKDVAGKLFEDDEIFDNANTVQQDLMMETFCNEKSFEVPLVSGQQAYDISSHKVTLIKEMFPSWNGNIKVIPNADWKKVRGMPGTAPVVTTIFGGKLFFAPTPKSELETVTIWAYQMDIVNPMDAETDPETPQTLDGTLIVGICAEFDPNFIPLYERQKLGLISILNRKHTMGEQVKQVW